MRKLKKIERDLKNLVENPPKYLSLLEKAPNIKEMYFPQGKRQNIDYQSRNGLVPRRWYITRDGNIAHVDRYYFGHWGCYNFTGIISRFVDEKDHPTCIDTSRGIFTLIGNEVHVPVGEICSRPVGMDRLEYVGNLGLNLPTRKKWLTIRAFLPLELGHTPWTQLTEAQESEIDELAQQRLQEYENKVLQGFLNARKWVEQAPKILMQRKMDRVIKQESARMEGALADSIGRIQEMTREV